VSIPPPNPARLTRLTNVALLLLLAPLFPARRVFSFASATGSSQFRTQDYAKVAVKTAYEAYLRAWKDKDYDALNELLSDDYQAVNFQGVISTKANEIATAKNDRTYDIMTGNVISVAVFGETAVVSGLIEASWRDESGIVQKSTFRFLAMLQKQKGDWKLVATQSTKFNKPAEPVER
jgi:ketosteroid isomerase-like protein